VDLFDPKTYRAVRGPLRDAETLPPACYTSQEFYQREVSEIFLKSWNLVGRADYVKKPGDYFTHMVGGVSFIVMRGDDGQIRAFVNACRHRGTQLLQGEGNCRTIRCPYHSWVYDSAGSLRGANGMQETRSFAASDYGLIGLRLETWEGFLFVNFDPNAESLGQYLGNLDAWTGSYGFEEMITVKRREFLIRANWKSYVENSLEHFHLPTVHQKTIGGVRAVWDPVDGAPGNFVILRSKTTASRATLGNAVSFGNIPTLRGPAAEGAQYILVYPCTVIGADLDCMWFKQMLPEGPDSMRLLAGFCFTKASVERPDFDEVVENYHRRFELVMGEDNDIAEKHLRGVLNPFARAGRLSSVEPLVHVIDNWILDRVVGPGREA
jgi:phenylpropionate dioxygenase-like ring-hydroxylating dioxygenase large terminal subunit